jgi:hypothetical protein
MTLSIPASWLFLYATEALTDELLPYTFPAASLLGWLGVMLVLASLASIIPVRSNATQVAVPEGIGV